MARIVHENVKLMDAVASCLSGSIRVRGPIKTREKVAAELVQAKHDFAISRGRCERSRAVGKKRWALLEDLDFKTVRLRAARAAALRIDRECKIREAQSHQGAGVPNE